MVALLAAIVAIVALIIVLKVLVIGTIFYLGVLYGRRTCQCAKIEA